MKLHIITKPTSVNDLTDLDTDGYDAELRLRLEHLEAKRMRKFKRQIA